MGFQRGGIEGLHIKHGRRRCVGDCAPTKPGDCYVQIERLYRLLRYIRQVLSCVGGD